MKHAGMLTRRALLAWPAASCAQTAVTPGLVTPGLVTPNVIGQQQLSYTNYVVRSRWQAGATALRVMAPTTAVGVARFEQSPRVVYVLPVLKDISFLFGDGFHEVVRLDLHNEYGVVMVAPTFTDIPWYGNHVSNPRVQQERYLLEDIVPLVDSLYPRARGKRLLLGFSKSGLGAFTLLLRNMPVFAAAAAWDAPLMINRFVNGLQMDEVYASEENFRRNFSLPVLVERNAAQLRESAPRLALLGYSVYGEDTSTANELLRSYSAPRYFDNETPMPHTWDSGWLPVAMNYLDKMSAGR
jgi:hypothetical protein